MRKLFTIILTLLPMLLFAQSAIPKAVTEYLNPQPRMERGDSQRYSLTVDYEQLDSNGVIVGIYRNLLGYTQLTLASSPDSMRFEIVVDSFAAGMPVTRRGPISSRSLMTDFSGYSFQVRYGKEIPTKDGCYDPSDILADNLHYTQAQEFMDQFTLIRLINQFRFMAGRQLGYIGDTVTMKLPGNICYQLSGLVQDYKLYQQPYKIWVAGISRYGKDPCALLHIEADPSPLRLDFITRTGKILKARGSKALSGEFLVALSNGALLSADLTERLTGHMAVGEDYESLNNRVIVTRLRAGL